MIESVKQIPKTPPIPPQRPKSIPTLTTEETETCRPRFNTNQRKDINPLDAQSYHHQDLHRKHQQIFTGYRPKKYIKLWWCYKEYASNGSKFMLINQYPNVISPCLL